MIKYIDTDALMRRCREKASPIDIISKGMGVNALAIDEINRIVDEIPAIDVEQGLLLRLPCKLGDTVYVVPSAVNFKLNLVDGLSENNKIYEQTVESIEVHTRGYNLTTCDGWCSYSSEFYGETWFLTHEEAEKKLSALLVMSENEGLSKMDGGKALWRSI